MHAGEFKFFSAKIWLDVEFLHNLSVSHSQNFRSRGRLKFLSKYWPVVLIVS